jgi:hypothetical protein
LKGNDARVFSRAKRIGEIPGGRKEKSCSKIMTKKTKTHTGSKTMPHDGPITKETSDLRSRFGAVTEKLKQTSALQSADPEVKRGMDRFRRTKVDEQDNKTTALKIDIENSPVWKVLNDTSLDAKEQAEEIAKLLHFNEEYLEANPKAITENQEVVKYLLSKFSELNREALKLRRDNPLSELRGGTRDVLEEYHKLVNGRSDLKEKLVLIDAIIEQHGGPEGLIKAMLSAKDKENEKIILDQGVADARIKVSGLTGEVRELDTESSALRRKLAENEGDPLLFFKGEKKRQIAEDRRARADVEAKIEMKRKDLSEATTELDSKSSSLAAFVGTEDYRVHEQILEVLDIGTDSFKQKLTDLADVTLNYIDYSQATMEGVRAQLEHLLNKAVESDISIQNTNEQSTILLEAQRSAQKHNALQLQKIEAEEAEGGVAGMKKEKKLRALNQHIKGNEMSIESTAQITGQLGQIQIESTLFRDQLSEGLADATKQQMLSTASATATGNGTIMRIEALATFVQGLIAEGAYKQETEYHLGELAKEMERGLMSRMAKNESLKSIGDVLKEMTDSMDERNDIVLQVAEEQHRLVERLVEQNERLNRANEDALAIESEVNKRLYGAPAGVPGGEPTAGAPSVPGLG